MALATLPDPILWPAHTNVIDGTPSVGTEHTLDAAGEYSALVFQAREAMTIAQVGWRTGAVSGSPTAETRIETVAADGTPSGTLWATNTNIVSGTLSANTFAMHTLTASASISAGQFFAVVRKYNSGTSFVVSRLSNVRWKQPNSPYLVTNVTGSAVKGMLAGTSILVLYSGSVYYNVPGCTPVIAQTNSAFSNSVAGAKRGARFQTPFKGRCCGLQWYNGANTGDFKITLFDDSGSELSSSETSVDGDHSVNANAGVMVAFFDNPVTLSVGTWYRVAIEPTSATNVNVSFAQTPGASYMNAAPGGANFIYTTYTTAGGWVDTATDSYPLLGLLFDQLDDGVSSSGGEGGLRRFNAGFN